LPPGNAGNAPFLAYFLSVEKACPSGKSKSYCHADQYDRFFPTESIVDAYAANHDGETALHTIARRDEAKFPQPLHGKALFEMTMGKELDLLKEDARSRRALDGVGGFDKDDIVALMRHK
jgi:hypothetical protein